MTLRELHSILGALMTENPSIQNYPVVFIHTYGQVERPVLDAFAHHDSGRMLLDEESPDAE